MVAACIYNGVGLIESSPSSSLSQQKRGSGKEKQKWWRRVTILHAKESDRYVVQPQTWAVVVEAVPFSLSTWFVAHCKVSRQSNTFG